MHNRKTLSRKTTNMHNRPTNEIQTKRTNIAAWSRTCSSTMSCGCGQDQPDGHGKSNQATVKRECSTLKPPVRQKESMEIRKRSRFKRFTCRLHGYTHVAEKYLTTIFFKSNQATVKREISTLTEATSSSKESMEIRKRRKANPEKKVVEQRKNEAHLPGHRMIW